MIFSVLIPTKDRLELLKQAVATVLSQNYTNWELIISDNFSNEDVGGFVNSLSDSRIIYSRTEKSISVTENWNRALLSCHGDYIIMLGDDDGLLPNYFTYIESLIKEFDYPDLIYTGALLYAYPDVIPGHKKGFLRSYQNRSIYADARESFKLNRSQARSFACKSLDFRVEFDFNMQFSLMSRNIIKSISRDGAFFESPYPDYYASNALFYHSRNILVVPKPMVVVGISPKSFGYFYFNGKEGEGTVFLNNMNHDLLNYPELEKIFLPGSQMNDCWLMSMQSLSRNFGLPVNYKRYREIQIRTVLSQAKLNNFRSIFRLLSRATCAELSYLIIPSLLRIVFSRKSERRKVRLKILEDSLTHPRVDMPSVEGTFTSLTEVYEYYETSI